MIRTEVEKKDKQIFVHNFDGERRVSGGIIGFTQSHLNGAVIPSLTIGGVGTDPEYRRSGLVHTIFTEVEKAAEEYSCPISYLHPFSFSYYRKKGYERIGDHRILEFPMSALDFVPRYADLVLCDTPEKAQDALDIYNRFAAGRNIMFVRTNGKNYLPNNNSKTYILYGKDGAARAYVIIGIENYYYVNRMVSVNLHVYEMCYTNKEDLLRLFGFLRMYEGELSTVKIHNCAMAPEVERTLRHYMHTNITVLPDLSARIHNVELMTDCADFFRAFPNRPCGLFEHF